jgi:hypothetical protein
MTPTADGEDWSAVAGALNARMAERRLTQYQLAVRSGISVATIRALQHATGRRSLDTTLAALSVALGWPDSYLLAVLLAGPRPDEQVVDDSGSPADADGPHNHVQHGRRPHRGPTSHGHLSRTAPTQVYAVVSIPDPAATEEPHTAVVYVAFESPAAAARFARRNGLTHPIVSPVVFDTTTTADTPPSAAGQATDPARVRRRPVDPESRPSAA